MLWPGWHLIYMHLYRVRKKETEITETHTHTLLLLFRTEISFMAVALLILWIKIKNEIPGATFPVSISCFVFNKTIEQQWQPQPAKKRNVHMMSPTTSQRMLALHYRWCCSVTPHKNWFNRDRTANPINLNQKMSELRNRICGDFSLNTRSHSVCVCMCECVSCDRNENDAKWERSSAPTQDHSFNFLSRSARAKCVSGFVVVETVNWDAY